MSEYSGTPGGRTVFKLEFEITARERQALERFLARRTVAGDVALVENIIAQILEVDKKTVD